jgi:hypothetical protein
MAENFECAILGMIDDELYTGPERWTKGTLVRDRDGVSTDFGSNAYSFCLLGVVDMAVFTLQGARNFGPQELTDLYQASSNVVRCFRDHVGGVANWNDARDRKFEEVKVLVKTVRAEVCNG